MKKIQTFEQFSIHNEEIDWKKMRDTAMAGAMAIGAMGAHGQDKDIKEMDKDPQRIERYVETDPIQYIKTKSGKKWKVESIYYEHTGFTTLYSGRGESDSDVTINFYHPVRHIHGSLMDRNGGEYYIEVQIKGKPSKKFFDLSEKGLEKVIKYLSSMGIGVYGL
jgi:hypothetical protein